MILDGRREPYAITLGTPAFVLHTAHLDWLVHNRSNRFASSPASALRSNWRTASGRALYATRLFESHALYAIARLFSSAAASRGSTGQPPPTVPSSSDVAPGYTSASIGFSARRYS